MNKFQNEGATDRVIRAILGIVFLVLAMFLYPGILRTILFVLAVASLLTAALGFCGLYKILGINTLKK